MHKKNAISLSGFMVFLICVMGMTQAWGYTAQEIDHNVDLTLGRLYNEVKDSKKLILDAKGVLLYKRWEKP